MKDEGLAEDRKFMRRAIELAKKGEGFTSPNPMVGAVIVKDGRIIGEGYHERYGGLHAERNALASVTESPEGAVIYVTLEPCCHYGKQPPCVDAILEAGIARVVTGSDDPNPLVAGKGFKRLIEHGVEVTTHVEKEACDALNPVFFHYIQTGLPYVAMKYAMTMDGRIASVSGDSKWISCEESRRLVHEMRGRYMGILAGKGTVMADDPMLNCRVGGMRQPVRIIADSEASTPEDSAIARTAGEYETILAHTHAAPEKKLEVLRGCGIRTMECPSAPDGRVGLDALMDRLGKEGMDSVFIEGGAEIGWSMVSGNLVDEYFIFIAPKIIGGNAAKGPVGGCGMAGMQDAVPLETASVTSSGSDLLIHGFAAGHKAYAEMCGRLEMPVSGRI